MADSTDITESRVAGADAFQQTLKVAFELHNAGRETEAEALCRVLLRQNERDGQLLFLLGMILPKLGRQGEALKYLEQAVELEPQSGRIFNGLGFVRQGLKNHAGAVAAYVRAIELGLRAADNYYSLGNAYYQLGEVERAAAAFQTAVDLKPQDVVIWNNLGKCLGDLGRLEESIRAYDRALEMNPHYALAHYGRALALLTSGRLADGFREYNQWRPCRLAKREFSRPAWQGEAVPGKTLFLQAEQGFGDAIQHARFIRSTRERAERVILECRPELKTLFQHSDCADVVIAYGEEIPPFDYFTSLINLPGILGVTLDTIPAEVPYLKAAAGGWFPSAPTGHLRVGLAWAGNAAHHNNVSRSMRLEELASLLAVPAATFYSLQISVPEQDGTFFRSHTGLVDLRGRMTDFLDTAAVVTELDLVIVVDTAVAHLAGALGKPVWTLLPYAPDWRWLRDRTDSPWYPTMRLFRQAQRNEWGPVVGRVAEELGKCSKKKFQTSK